MALLLICKKTLAAESSINRVRIFYQFPTNPAVFSSHHSSASAATTRLLRTSGLGNCGPYDRSQVRKNSASASITLPHVKVKQQQQQITPAKTELPSETENNIKQKQDDNLKIERLKERTLINALTCMTKTYDLLTLPFYALVQQPWKKIALHKAKKAVIVNEAKNEWGCILPPSAVHLEMEKYKIDTLDKLFSHALTKQDGNKTCLGTREILGETEEIDASSGKSVKKYELGGYQWKTFSEVNILATNLSRGFGALGLGPKEKIAIFAETRAEWLITAMAAFKLSLPIVTVFTTLADDGVIHALKETEVTCLFTSEELMPRCYDILESTPLIKNIVYMGNSTLPDAQSKVPGNVAVHTLSSLVKHGKSQCQSETNPESKYVPQPSDTAIIMYTSGSTGVPKGVVISNWNLVAALKACTDSLASVGEANENDSYIAYLPLGHVMELISEAMCLLQGVRIGYSSPLTLTDKSPGVKEGSKGDASLLQPTILASVPLVLERIVKGIQIKVADNGKFAATLFNFFHSYKMGWTRAGYDTPLVDKIFFNRIRDLVGGKVRLVICGGAPLAPQTHEFVKSLLCCPLLVGYGLTETSGSGSMCLGTDISVGRAGGPISCTNFRLINWEEGGYRVTDKPYPRGELYIGGDNVAMGYFKQNDSNAFFEDDGKRWIRTGDIAEVHEDGVLKIIDRKKDLVKLSCGEYISLGKVEAMLKTIPIVENICVCADPLFPQPVAIVVASQPQLEALAAKLGRNCESFTELTKDPLIVDSILSQIQRRAKKLKLEKYEIPNKIHISSEVWMPQSGLVTAAFKIKRNNVYKEYRNEIQRMLQGPIN